MKHLKNAILAVLAAAFLALASGCTTQQKGGSIPWSRPADWEGRIPGMGG